MQLSLTNLAKENRLIYDKMPLAQELQKKRVKLINK